MGKLDIVGLLEAELDSDVLTLNSRVATFKVIAWYNPALMLKDYLQNHKYDMLFTVKRSLGLADRLIQHVARRQKVDFDIGVWLIDSPSYSRGEKDVLRDASVEEVKRVITENPAYATLKAQKEDDHAKGNLWVLNSVVTVTVTSIN